MSAGGGGDVSGGDVSAGGGGGVSGGDVSCPIFVHTKQKYYTYRNALYR